MHWLSNLNQLFYFCVLFENLLAQSQQPVSSLDLQSGSPNETVAPLKPACIKETEECHFIENNRNEYSFVIKNQSVVIQFLEGKHFELTCPAGLALEDDAVPRFSREARVEVVRLTACGARPSLASVLRDLNLRPLRALVLLELPAGAVLGDLPADLRQLQLSAPDTSAPRAPLPALPPLPALAALHVTRLALDNEVLLALPPTLTELHIIFASIQNVSVATWDAVVGRLAEPARVVVRVSEAGEGELWAGGRWAGALGGGAAWLDAPVTSLPSPGGLRDLTLWHAAAGATVRAAEWRRCELRRLNVAYWPRAALPPDWLAGCLQLQRLELMYVGVESLPERLVASPALTELVVSHCGAARVSPTLLSQTPSLRRLDLSHNALQHLPDGLFASLRALEELDLSHNALAAAALARPLQALATLQVLRVSDNPLGAMCAGDEGGGVRAAAGVSALAQLVSLRELHAARSGVRAVCRDWRQQLHALQYLDLADNDIAALSLADLRYVRNVRAEVDLRGNPVARVHVSREEYRAALAGGDHSSGGGGDDVTVWLDARLTCDCHMYWAAQLAREAPATIVGRALRGVRCAGRGAGATLVGVALDVLRCAVPDAGCAPGCRCTAQPAGGEAARDEVTAQCGGAALTRVPQVPAAALRDTTLRLLVANNSISSLLATDLPPNLTMLDLRNNSLSEISEETLTALVSDARLRLLLSGNTLRCECAARAALSALQRHHHRVGDYAALRCHDGRALAALVPGELCAARSLLAGGHAALAVAAALALAVLLLAGWVRARHSLVPRVKAELLRRGVCVAWALRVPGAELAGDDDKPYDAFVSFAHGGGDDEWVARELVPALEARGYCVCVHYRDWTPGELITSQIDRSVLSARRTLAVLSDQFAASAWARAEFRAARALAVRDGRARLVALVPVSGVPRALQAELRAHVESNTYLRRDDVWFWHKLCAALGPPRTPPPPAHTAPPAYSLPKPDIKS